MKLELVFFTEQVKKGDLISIEFEFPSISFKVYKCFDKVKEIKFTMAFLTGEGVNPNKVCSFIGCART